MSLLQTNFLSVIVPVYLGEDYIKANLSRFKQAIATLKGKAFNDFEIIAVIDGDLDESAREAKKVKGIQVISYKNNQGKGHALVEGFKASKGDSIAFLDADGDFPPKQLANLFPYLSTAHLVVGSKRHPFSKIHYPWIRRFLSLGFQLLSKLILGISISDTQSGLKLMQRPFLEVIVPSLVIKQFAFDLELCFLAERHGFRMVEAPIRIDFQGKSSINIVRQSYAMLKDLLSIRWRYSFKKTYQKKYQAAKLDFK